jgi:two-component sensor histidine kinase
MGQLYLFLVQGILFGVRLEDVLYSYRVLPDRSMCREWLVENPYAPAIDIVPVAQTNCWFDVVVPEDQAKVLLRTRRLLAGERSVDQVRAVANDGRTVELCLFGMPTCDAGGVERILGSVSAPKPGQAPDSAASEQAKQIAALQAEIEAREQQLRCAFEDIRYTAENLRRCRLMVSEHGHRSKNNAQLAVSLVRSIKSNQAGLTAEQIDAIDRLGAMARTDALLLRNNDEPFEPAGPYLREIAEQTVRFRGGEQIGVDCEVAALKLSGAELRTLGMILHELVTNAIRHAFPSGVGHIKIRLLAHGDERAELCVLDNGVGIPVADSGHPARGTGIISELVQQLGGEWSIEPLDRGTLAKVLFRREPQ